jgi:hypothetical protein
MPLVVHGPKATASHGSIVTLAHRVRHVPAMPLGQVMIVAGPVRLVIARLMLARLVLVRSRSAKAAVSASRGSTATARLRGAQHHAVTAVVVANVRSTAALIVRAAPARTPTAVPHKAAA